MGGGIIILAKKGLSLFGICLFLGVRDSRQIKKKRKKGRARKKNGGNKWTRPPTTRPNPSADFAPNSMHNLMLTHGVQGQLNNLHAQWIIQR
jgi:hypothetical protein